MENEFLKLNEGDKVVYVGVHPYQLANRQEVEKAGDELIIRSKVTVQSKFFKHVKPQQPVTPPVTPPNEEKPLEEMNKDELIVYADKNGIDVDKRKGEEKILAEIKEALK